MSDLPSGFASAAVVIGDVHLSDKRPIARRDNDWVGYQMTQLKHAVDTARRLGVWLIIAGDLFDVSRVSPTLLNATFNTLMECDYMVLPGNHDMLHHSIDHLHRTSLGTLYMCRKASALGVKLQDGRFQGFQPYDPLNFTSLNCTGGSSARISITGIPFPANEEYTVKRMTSAEISISIAHRMVVKSSDSRGYLSASRFMKMTRPFDVSFTGDNHDTFEYSCGKAKSTVDGKRHLINVGNYINRSVSERDRDNWMWVFGTQTPGRGGYRVFKIPVPDCPEWADAPTIEYLKGKQNYWDAFSKLIKGIEDASQDEAKDSIYNYLIRMRKAGMIDEIVYKLAHAYLRDNHD